MFHKQPKQMQGITQFETRGFELTKVTKGRDAWKSFEELMKSNEYEKCNKFT